MMKKSLCVFKLAEEQKNIISRARYLKIILKINLVDQQKWANF